MGRLSETLLNKISSVPEITPVRPVQSVVHGMKTAQELQGGDLQNQRREQLLMNDQQRGAILGQEHEWASEDRIASKETEAKQKELGLKIMNRVGSEVDEKSKTYLDDYYNIVVEEAISSGDINTLQTALKLKQSASKDELERKKIEVQLKKAQSEYAKSQRPEKGPNLQGDYTATLDDGSVVNVTFNPDSRADNNYTIASGPFKGQPLPDGVVAEKSSVTKAKNTKSAKTKGKMVDRQVGVQDLVNNASTAYNMLEKDPDLNTFVASASSLIADAKQEAKAIAKSAGVDIDPTDASTFNSYFQGLNIGNRKLEALVVSLAFKAAKVEADQSGRSVSDKDVVKFTKMIGASASDPEAFKSVLRDLAERNVDSFKNEYRIRNEGEEWGGDFGISKLFNSQQNDPSTMNPEQIRQRILDANPGKENDPEVLRLIEKYTGVM